MYEPRRYAEWLHSEVFLPVVVVIGSDAAKARVKEANGLSLAELFAPFGGHFRGISVSAQSLERQIPIENLRVRYVDADLAVQLSTLQADQVAAWTVESSALAGRPDSLEAPSPWYEQWRNALFGALRWSEHEALDQPAAAMLVVLSKEPDPVMQLEQLLHASKMPPLCTQGVLDPVPSRVAVLLHDLSDPESPSKEDFDKNLASIRARFAPNLVLPLHINHGDAKFTMPEAEDLFKSFLVQTAPPPPPPPPEAADEVKPSPGSRLTREDLQSLAQVGTEVVVKSAVPWMEKQLQQLEAQISQARKGFRNQLKYLWRKPREGARFSRLTLKRLQLRARHANFV
ncbi:TRAPPC8 [Symbiodinium natans]|uniref:TRAPPC8 protein n=1 Tax=Symbiodinium natans TaxID=878477 RepID=A0A812M098_9DINO|nr:TRAPPC8 [Symbiodinium natans]